MKITILAIGKKHDPRLEVAIVDYTKRLTRYVQCEWKLLEAKIAASMSEAEIRNAESELILANCPQNEILILLDERGKLLSSPDVAQKFQSYMNQAAKSVTIIIGGAYGVSGELQKRAGFIWSLSPLVFPHQLVRLILIEQIYRAYTILAGEKYHHL